MTGELHPDGLVRYVVPIAETSRFTKGHEARGVDKRGDPISGIVTEIKEGSNAAIIVAQPAPGGSGQRKRR